MATVERATLFKTDNITGRDSQRFLNQDISFYGDFTDFLPQSIFSGQVILFVVNLAIAV